MSTALRRGLTAIAITASAALALAGCSGAGDAAEPAADESTTVVIETNNGDVEVTKNPVRVAALDNTSFSTLKAFGIDPVVVPKPLLPTTGFEAWADDAEVLDAGSHREPNLEAINEAEPDLIIGGYRFTDYQDDLEKIGTTIDIAPSDESADGYVEALKSQTLALGEIFDKQDEAAEIVEALTASVDAAAAETTGQSVFLAVATGGKIDNGASRIGRIIAELDLTNVLEAEDASSTAVHNDSGLAPETIAQLNPEWLIVMDRDAATVDGEFTPAKTLVESQEAWANTTFLTEGNIVYLDPNFYVDEGIQAYTEAFDSIAEAIGASN